MSGVSTLSVSCPITVRPCGLHEVERLRELRSRALGDSPGAFRQTQAEHEAVPGEVWRAHVAARAAAGDGVLVAETCGEWVGMVFALVDEEGCGRLGGLWVAPEARGHRVGRALVSAGLAWLRAAEVRRVTILVDDDSAAARATLSAAGFEPTGARSTPLPGAVAAAEEFELELPPKSLRAPPLAAHA